MQKIYNKSIDIKKIRIKIWVDFERKWILIVYRNIQHSCFFNKA